MDLFKGSLSRNAKRARPMVSHNAADPFAGQGFVYHETLTSPDGSILIFCGYSGGEKGPTIIEPRAVIAATGRVLFDLWNTYQHHSIHFVDASSRAEMRVENTHNRREHTVEIDFANETFAFKENPEVRYELAKLPELISLF